MTTSTSDELAIDPRLAEKLAELGALIEEREDGKAQQLPLWPEPTRGAPNTFLRSALFAAIHGRSRRSMRGELIASLGGITVKYTGEQLIQSDLDVWETLVHLARRQTLGSRCRFSAHSMLKSMQRDTGKAQHAWLHGALTRLGACMVEISAKGYTNSGSLVDEFMREDATGLYLIRLNRKLIHLFQDNDWTQLDWQQRQAMRRQPLAQALHAFYSTHRAPYPMRVRTLHKLTGSTSKELRDFKRKVKNALGVLVEHGFLEDFDISPSEGSGEDLVTVARRTKRASRTTTSRGKARRTAAISH